MEMSKDWTRTFRMRGMPSRFQLTAAQAMSYGAEREKVQQPGGRSKENAVPIDCEDPTLRVSPSAWDRKGLAAKIEEEKVGLWLTE